MSDCDRLERELLADLLAGDDDHVASCAACRARQPGYDRIAEGLARVHAGVARRPDHVARVLARAPRRGPARWVAGGAALAIAAALIVWLVGRRPSPQFAVEVIAARTGALRGDAQLGDRVRVRAAAGEAVWMFRNDRELVLVCPRDCQRVGDGLVGEAALDSIGRYQIVWLSSERVPDPGADFERAVAAARAAGARYELRELDVE